MIDEECFDSLRKAGDYARIKRQAILIAIKKGKLKAVKKGHRWCVKRSDIDDYRANKYNRDERKINGEYIFDMEKGFFSTNQVCKVISSTLNRPFPIQRLYYLMRTGQIKCMKKGSAWVIEKEHAVALLEKELEKDKKISVS